MKRYFRKSAFFLRCALRAGPMSFFSVASHPRVPKVNVFLSTKDDIHFNLATEEFLFDHLKPDAPTLFLWRNDKTIVIGKTLLTLYPSGKHQNPWKEC
jgi:lipoate-protein ligase A